MRKRRRDLVLALLLGGAAGCAGPNLGGAVGGAEPKPSGAVGGAEPKPSGARRTEAKRRRLPRPIDMVRARGLSQLSRQAGEDLLLETP